MFSLQRFNNDHVVLERFITIQVLSSTTISVIHNKLFRKRKPFQSFMFLKFSISPNCSSSDIALRVSRPFYRVEESVNISNKRSRYVGESACVKRRASGFVRLRRDFTSSFFSQSSWRCSLYSGMYCESCKYEEISWNAFIFTCEQPQNKSM